MMIHGGHSASTAAAAVGYESPSQFGREFKRFFGAPPGAEAASVRTRLADGAVEADSGRAGGLGANKRS